MAKFSVGERIEVQGVDGRWYPAIVATVNGDKTYNVTWEKASNDSNLNKQEIILRRPQVVTASSSLLQPSPLTTSTPSTAILSTTTSMASSATSASSLSAGTVPAMSTVLPTGIASSSRSTPAQSSTGSKSTDASTINKAGKEHERGKKNVKAISKPDQEQLYSLI